MNTNSFDGSGVLVDSPPLPSTPSRRQHNSVASVARVPTSDSEVSPLRPRSSRAAAGDDFLAIMKMQIIQDR